MRSPPSILLCFIAGLFSGLATAQESRGMGVAINPASPSDGPGKSYALIIGIDEYDDDQLTDLNGATRDAKAVAKVLEQQGFEITLLLNREAHYRKIIEVLSEDLQKQINYDDQLIVYFAGHGVEHRALGYLIPQNGSATDERQNLSMRLLYEHLDTLRAKEILYIADACHSGFIHQSQRGASDRVRVSMTAGTAEQKVAEDFNNHGLFTWFFLQGIGGEADLIADQQITTTELQAYLQAKVPEQSRFQQTPQRSQVGHGDFTFPLDSTRSSPNESEGPEVRYFADYVWKHGVMDGIIPLTEAQIKERPFYYRFELVDGRVQTVQYRNSADHPVMDITHALAKEAFDFWKDAHLISWIDLGVARWEHRYHEGGTGDIAEVLMMDAQGTTIRKRNYPRNDPKRVDFLSRNDRPIDEWQLESLGKLFYPSEGKRVYGQGFQLDEQGWIDQEWYLNESLFEQVRLPNQDGWGWGYARNERGQPIRTWPIDDQGQPTTLVNGLAEIRYGYNDQSQLVDVTWWDTNESPLVYESGYSQATLTYDSSGRLSHLSFWGPKGRPVLAGKRCASIEFERNDWGNPIATHCWGKNGKRSGAKRSIHVEYDDRGYPLKASGQYGKVGEPYEAKLRFDENSRLVHVLQSDRDQDGCIEHKWEHRNAMEGPISQRIRRHTCYSDDGSVVWWRETVFDDRDQLIRQIDHEVNPSTGSIVHDESRFRVNARGDVTAEQFFDENGTKILRHNVAEIRYRTNHLGQNIEETYFGTNGEPVLNDTGFHRIVFTFSEQGYLMEQSHFGLDGEPVNDHLGTHRTVFTHNAWGQPLTRQNYDRAGEVVPETNATGGP